MEIKEENIDNYLIYSIHLNKIIYVSFKSSHHFLQLGYILIDFAILLFVVERIALINVRKE